MKYALIFIAAFVATFALTWASGAYITQIVNPLDWHDAGRFIQLFLSLAGAVLVTAAYADIIDDAFTETP